MTAKRWIALAIAAVLLILYAVGQMASGALVTAESGDIREEVLEQGNLDKIAVIDVEGVIMDQPQGAFQQAGYHHKTFMDQLEHAFEDDQVKGIILQINSPGGGVVESDEIYHKIRDFKEEYPDKPIVTYMSNTAASGGYYIAAPTDKIYANRSTITGSIGVIISTYDISELAENWGIKDNSFTSGPHKDILSPMRETTDEEREIIQSIVDEMYDQFVDVVDQGRTNLSRQEVVELADGRIYTGGQAQRAGLVDEIGFLDDSIAGVSDLAGVENPTVVRYKRSGMAFMNEYFGVIGDFGSRFERTGLQDFFHAPNQPYAMYLMTW
ncbi:signal peptide peptidase SppA [Caldalkalibacillus salinus]|uniref:signal peptide peptidase SppA n=1 Tax=Caldalkalibacillus salinus TaxID=2803787 RepID=UPI00192073D9|nr:signal peptide peptidase SppA [Caldalkalibacillus salinus]